MLRDATRFIKRLEDAVPGSLWKFVIEHTVGEP